MCCCCRIVQNILQTFTSVTWLQSKSLYLHKSLSGPKKHSYGALFPRYHWFRTKLLPMCMANRCYTFSQRYWFSTWLHTYCKLLDSKSVFESKDLKTFYLLQVRFLMPMQIRADCIVCVILVVIMSTEHDYLFGSELLLHRSRSKFVYMYRVGQKTGLFLKVCNSRACWHRIAFYTSNCSVFYPE